MYTLDTTRHFKIWFSKNPDCFLGFENQLRLIKMRILNPEITLNFIYSSKCLTQQAIENLQEFCKKYNIVPIDFDNDIEPLLLNPDDRVIYSIAKFELQHARSNTGGNLAAASDCVRIITPVLQQFGMYSDCDVDILFKGLDKTKEIIRPILLAANSVIQDNHELLHINNEIIGVASNPNQWDALHPDALKAIKTIQASLISHYRNPQPALDSQLAKSYLQQHPQATIFEYRQYCLNFNIIDYLRTIPKELYNQHFTLKDLEGLSEPEILQIVKTTLDKENIENLSCHDIVNKAKEKSHFLMLASVAKISGPICYFDIIPHNPKAVLDFSIPKNGLSAHIKSNNGSDGPTKECFIDNVGCFGDLSWTPLGETKLSLRERRMHQAARCIQNAWQGYKDSKNAPPPVASKTHKRKASTDSIDSNFTKYYKT